MKKSLLEVSVVVTTSPAVSDTPTLVKGAFDPGSVVPMVLQPSLTLLLLASSALVVTV
jgi:hypothetical protein